jgi:hypothetical protein
MFKLIILSSALISFKSTEIRIKTKENQIFQLNNFQLNEAPFVFYIEQVGNSKLLRVSFNGNEGNEGTLKIYNSQNALVLESNFELIKSPFFASVDVTNLQAGDYSLVLSTAVDNHTSQLIIQ